MAAGINVQDESALPTPSGGERLLSGVQKLLLNDRKFVESSPPNRAFAERAQFPIINEKGQHR